MTTRELPRSEWSKLAGTELESVSQHLPDAARVLVVEEDGDVIGCWAFFPVIHAEGVYIAEAHRGKSAVARRLLKGMREIVCSMGAKAVCTAAETPDVEALIGGLGGVKLPGTHWVLATKGRV
jgi:hypothetical protein